VREILVQGGDAVVVERRRAGAEDRRILGARAEGSLFRIIWRATSRSASAPPWRSNLLIATTSAKSSMSIFSSRQFAWKLDKRCADRVDDAPGSVRSRFHMSSRLGAGERIRTADLPLTRSIALNAVQTCENGSH
jgi:hypothetical protein